MPITRRRFLRRTAAATAATATPLASLFSAKMAEAQESAFGPLLDDPRRILNLPEGFSYVVIQRQGDVMSDGVSVPGLPDGMAAFSGGEADPAGSIILMRNHEVRPDGDRSDAFFGREPTTEQAAMMPDPGAFGGVSRVVLDGGTFLPTASNTVLAGTYSNCAGGPSPWGWITCEESTDILSTAAGTGASAATDWHGYCYVTRTDATGQAMPERLDAYGRFNHEAVAIDTATNTAYLTEDRTDGYFYRFVPNDPAEPFGAGRFQALGRLNEEIFDTTTMLAGDVIQVAWRDIDNPTPNVSDGSGAGAEPTARQQAFAAGAATVVRGEGCWMDDARGVVYFTATFGGELRLGQIFRYVPTDRNDPDAGGLLECIARPEDRDVMFNPDNIAVAPWGEIFFVEDSFERCRLLVLNPSTGVISPLAQNPNRSAELAGVCFAPGRSDVVFMNLQREGITVAITGPFDTTEVDPNLPDPPAPTEDMGTGADMGGADMGAADMSVDAGAPADDEGGGCSTSDAAIGLAQAGVAAAAVAAVASKTRKPADEDAQ
ncbi:MAG: alkaline phosphatase PhoX [Myxococcota bacterium]